MRIFRGLFLGLSLSALNLVGMFLTVLLLGGLGDWTPRQFIGLFGVFEVATGLAFIVCPNAWRLPVIQVETRRTDALLTASTLFIPHWAGGAKSLAGIVMIGFSAQTEGIGWETALVGPFVVTIAVLTVAVSALAAAWGVRHPSVDVLYFKIDRAHRSEVALPGISVSAATMQIMLGTFTLPTIKLLSPGVFFRPAIGPSFEANLMTLAATLLVVALVLFVWRGRISWKAAAEQQQLAEQPA